MTQKINEMKTGKRFSVRAIATVLCFVMLLTAIGSCQIISNVPSAILLSEFTTNYKELLLGVNIGGVGTLISSLASLITFREYGKHEPGKIRYYLGRFTVINFAFLVLLTGFMLGLRHV